MANEYIKCSFQSQYDLLPEKKTGSVYRYKTGAEMRSVFENIKLSDFLSISFMDYSGSSSLEIDYNIKEGPVVFSFILKGGHDVSLSRDDNSTVNLSGNQGTSRIRVKNTPNIKGLFKILPSERYTSISVHVDEQFLKDYLRDEAEKLPENFYNTLYKDKGAPYERFTSGINPSMMSAANEAFRYLNSGNISRLYLSSKANELVCLKLFQMMEQNKKQSSKLTKKDRQNILSARGILIENLSKPLSVRELARKVGINRFKLQQGFKEEFGTTVYEYLNHCRMEKALETMNQEECTVYETAARVGYSNVSKFIKAFKSKYGVTPGKFVTKR